MPSGPPDPASTVAPEGATLLRRNTWLAAATLVGALLAIPMRFLLRGASLDLDLLLALVAYVGGLVAFSRTLTNPASFFPAKGRLSVRERALFLDDARLVGRAEVEQVSLSTSPDGATILRLQTKRGLHKSLPITIALTREADADALVRALALDATRSVAGYRVGSRLMLDRRRRRAILGLFSLSVLAAFVALGADAFVSSLLSFVMGPATLLGSVGAMLAFSIGLIWPTRILVGPDGVVIRWLLRARTIPLTEIDDVVRAPGMLQLHLRSGEIVEMVYPGKPPSEAELARQVEGGQLSGVAELGRAGQRIEEALAAHRAGRSAAPELGIERGARPVGEWLGQLRALGRGTRADQASYRQQVVPRETLWSLIENPATLPTARVGAAVVLAETLDEPGRRRLRIAADASALPGVRGALDALAKDRGAEEAELAALLEAAADDEAREGAKGTRTRA